MNECESTIKEWKESSCEETYYVTLTGKWNNFREKIWETDDHKLFKIDGNNYLTPYSDNDSKQKRKRDSNECETATANVKKIEPNAKKSKNIENEKI